MKSAKAIEKIRESIEGWTDEQVLEVFGTFLERVGLASQFVQNEDELFTHQILTIQCGDKIIVSEAQELEWPLQLLPMPEALKGQTN